MDGTVIGRRLSSESGFTLIELLVAATLMIVVLSATLTSFEGFLNTNRRNTSLNDLQENVRTQVDRVTAQLRNLANPTAGGVSTINYADSTRIVFQTTDPTKQWVSYCLNTAQKVIYYQVSTKATVGQQLSTTPCPSNTTSGSPSTTDWTPGVKVGPNVTNGASRPMFVYAGENGAITVPAAGLNSEAQTSQITRVTVNLYVDDDPAKAPAEVNIQSGAYMRNQNQAPTAQFSTFRSGTKYTFDAGQSDDPEERTLQYYWYEESGTPADTQKPGGTAGHTYQGDLADCSTTQSTTIGGLIWKCLGTGVILSHNFSGETTPQNIWLLVVDPGNLATLSAMPTGGPCPAYDTSLSTLPTLTSNCRSVSF